MSAFNTLRETWNTQWGPEPVLALHTPATARRAAPITLPFGGDPFGGPNANRSHTRKDPRRLS